MSKNTSQHTATSNENDNSAERGLGVPVGALARPEGPALSLPCAGTPLIATACGCDSPAKIVGALNRAAECPFGRPWGCPLRLPPYL